MLDASSTPIDHFPALLARIPPDIDLDALARAAKAFQRPRGVRSAADLLRLALAWGPGGYSMQRVAAWAGERNIASLTEDALVQRLHAAGPFLEELTRQLLIHVGETPCWHGRVLRVCDGTNLSGQASKGTNWRVHGVYDLGRGRFTHLEVTDSHGGEALDRGTPVVGEIRVADRGYANAQAWQRFLQARDRANGFHRPHALEHDQAGGRDRRGIRSRDVVADPLADSGNSRHHGLGSIGQTSDAHQTRLIARRKPCGGHRGGAQAPAPARQPQQHEIDPRSLIAAEFVVLATSLPRGGIPAEEVLAVYRLRWQIELAFKG